MNFFLTSWISWHIENQATVKTLAEFCASNSEAFRPEGTIATWSDLLCISPATSASSPQYLRCTVLPGEEFSRGLNTCYLKETTTFTAKCFNSWLCCSNLHPACNIGLRPGAAVSLPIRLKSCLLWEKPYQYSETKPPLILLNCSVKVYFWFIYLFI